MDVAHNSRFPEKDTASEGLGSKEVLSTLLAAVAASKRPAAWQIVSQLKARVGPEVFEAVKPTVEKIAYVLDGQALPPEAIRAVTAIVAELPQQPLEAHLSVFRAIQKFNGRQPSDQEWRIVEAYCQPELPSLDFIGERRNAWLIAELHNKLSSDFERKVGALPAVLALVRLSGLIDPERVPEAADILVARAQDAAQPVDVEFNGKDALALSQLASAPREGSPIPPQQREQITKIFQGMLGYSIGLHDTEVALSRMATALRCTEALAELYRLNGWDLAVPVASMGEVLTLPNLRLNAAVVYESLVDQLALQGKRVDKILPVVSYIARDGLGPEAIAQFLSVMELFKPDAFSSVQKISDWLHRYFIEPHKPQIAHDFIRIALALTRFKALSLFPSDIPGSPKLVADHLWNLTALNASPIILTGLRKELERGAHMESTKLERLTRHLVAHAALTRLVSAASPEEHREAGRLLSQVYSNDSPPFPQRFDQVDPEAQRFLDETFRVIRRSLDQMNGFGAHEFEARRPLNNTPSALEEFLRSSGGEVLRLNSSSNDRFPGSGFVVSGIDPARFLRADKANPDEPFSQYKTMWPWVGSLIPDLKDTTFISSRGLQVVIPPATRRYGLHSRHYSYLVFNAHFDNTEQHGALLVPTRILLRQLQGGLIPLEEYRGFSSAHRDICDGGLTAKALLELGERAGIPVLNLSWPSNVAGLMRAYPPNRPPYHEWENRHTSIWRDNAGHVHHSFIAGSFIPSLTNPAVSSRIKTLIEAHGRVRDLAEHLQGLFTLFHYAEAAFSKGQFIEGPQVDSPESDVDEELEQGSPAQNDQAARKIRHSLDWHRRAETGSFPRESFPVLAIVPTAQFCPSPEKIVPLLDTADFSTIVDGKKRYLLRELHAESHSWRELSDQELSSLVLQRLAELHPQVGEIFERMGKRLRLLHRNLVYQSKNPERGDRHAQSSASPD